MHCHDIVCFVHTFHLFRSMPYYAYHACLCHLLAIYASLHACLYVHAWVLLASVSSILQHNEVMDIWSKPTFVLLSSWTPSFVCFLACLFAISFACLPVSLFLCLPYLSCLFTLRPLAIIYAISFHCLSTGFLVFAFACTHMEWGHVELAYDLLGASKKGMDASMQSSWVAAFNRSRV